MNYGGINEHDVANGKGVRVSIFVSGCKHACKNCFNSEVWDFNYGEKYTKEVEDSVLKALDKPYIKGLSLLGGEPMYPTNQEHLVNLVKRAKEMYPDKDIWCYTGFEFDTDILMKMRKFLPYTSEMLKYLDVLVDGKYVDEIRDLKLLFRGSRNQRIIDVQKSLELNKVYLHDEYKDDMDYENIRIDNLYVGNLKEEQIKTIDERKNTKKVVDIVKDKMTKINELTSATLNMNHN